jgi:arylsulfatase A
VDVLPTLCSVLGRSTPEDVHIDGSNILPLIMDNGAEFERHQPLFWHLQKSRPIVAMRDGNYSLVAEPDYELSKENRFDEAWIPVIKKGGYKNYQLFDLSKDPSQTTDLAAAHPERLDRLKKKLLQINASVMADGADWHLRK